MLEATDRILYDHKEVIDAGIMMFTAGVSLVCNIFNLFALGHFPIPCLKNGPNIMDNVDSIY